METGEKLLILSNGNAYPRNQVLVKALSGIFSTEIRTLSSKSGGFRFIKNSEAQNIFFLWPASHLALSLLAAHVFGKDVIYDAFTSMHDSLVNDRQTVKPGSIRSFYLYIQDYLCCHLADVLIFDTQGHKDYFFRTFKIKSDKPYAILPVTVDLDWFELQTPRPRSETDGKTEILFYGSFIPLQGIATILEAVNLTRDLPIHFSIIGCGQTHAQMLALAEKLRLMERVTFLPPVAYPELIGYVKSTDICLGIFGRTDKAQRVIPNKVLECAACGKPVITGANPDLKHYFKDKESILFCPMGDAVSLAETIRWAVNNAESLSVIGRQAQTVVEANFSLPALTDNIRTAKL